MSSSTQNNEERTFSTEAYIRKYVVHILTTDLMDVAIDIPVSEDTTGRPVSDAQRQARIQNCMYLLYFIINANTKNQVFANDPVEPQSREPIDIRWGRYNVMSLTEEYLSHFLHHCLEDFPQIPDLQLCFTLASSIMHVMGWHNVCVECGQRFPQKQSLKSHVKNGHKQRDEYRVCSFPQCNTVCKGLRSLIRHQVEAHGVGNNWQKNVISFQLLQNEVITVAALCE